MSEPIRTPTPEEFEHYIMRGLSPVEDITFEQFKARYAKTFTQDDLREICERLELMRDSLTPVKP